MQRLKDLLKIVALLAIIAAGYEIWHDRQLARQTAEREAEFKSSQICSELAEKFWQKQVRDPVLFGSSRSGPGYANHVDYKSHFSKTKNACYVEVTDVKIISTVPHVRQLRDPPDPNYNETNYYLYDATDSTLIASLHTGFAATVPEQEEHTLIVEETGKTTKVGVSTKELDDKYNNIRKSLMTQ